MTYLDDLNPEKSTREHLTISDGIKGYILYLGALLDQSEEFVFCKDELLLELSLHSGALLQCFE